ncbi:hypothetical protein [Candidatus Sulfurimonas baltica]|uniref:Uncharacterized protein n=1 Tax=Candidatus Sulfurimonas baltica TaxID=2740404 RepID=A0A7S7LW02_9BACT|nr:hypothetical protein [Candidatus Sulfurimonas baltica]QOY52478.1 hypothetical protein HUE88_01920 [Candidatus Sulfurimonas baltica]
MKESNPIWDYEDYYYFAFVGYIEINIRAYKDREIQMSSIKFAAHFF